LAPPGSTNFGHQRWRSSCRQDGENNLGFPHMPPAPQRERVGAFEIGTGESFAVRHGRGSSVSLIPCSSVEASVDIGS
jgi:hypothetical protein